MIQQHVKARQPERISKQTYSVLSAPMGCFIVAANQPVICHYAFSCIRHSGSSIKSTLKHQRRVRWWAVTHTCHKHATSEIIGSCLGGIYYKERSCVVRGPDIKGLRGRKRPRAKQIERARWESESGHRMFESCSWDPDDRVVFGNLRARPQKWAFPPPQRNGPGRKALAFKASTALFILHIFIAGTLSKGGEDCFPISNALTSVFYFPTPSLTMSLLPERRSLEVCM